MYLSYQSSGKTSKYWLGLERGWDGKRWDWIINAKKVRWNYFDFEYVPWHSGEPNYAAGNENFAYAHIGEKGTMFDAAPDHAANPACLLASKTFT